MSVSKWAYDPERCDGDYCPGDCDNCSKWMDDEEEEEDVVKVVRCKDCRRYDGLICVINNLYTDEDGFCSYGVRRE